MATTQGGQLDGGRLLSELSIKDPRMGQLLQNVIDGVNRVAKNSGVSAVGDVCTQSSGLCLCEYSGRDDAHLY